MDEKQRKPFQFRLRTLFIAVADVALVAAAFRWLGTETAVIAILAALLLWPLRRTDWPATIKALGWLALVLVVLLSGMAYMSLMGDRNR